MTCNGFYLEPSITYITPIFFIADGNTAMNIAIENSNLKAVKLLCLNGADINHVHKKSGYTPLRFAIEKQIPDMISYILQHKDVNPSIEDFGGVTPLQAAMAKENSEVKALISDFMVSICWCIVVYFVFFILPPLLLKFVLF